MAVPFRQRIAPAARARAAALGLVVAFLVCACTAGPPPPAATTPAAGATSSAIATASPAAPPSGPEAFTPLLMRLVSPDPIPVKGSDGRLHLVYELEVQNASPRPATITTVQILDEETVVSSIEAEAVTALSMIVGDYALPPVPADVVPPGRSVLLILEAAFDDQAAVPASLQHRISATFGAFEPNQGDFAVNNFPDETVATGGLVAVGTGEPEVVGPPMTGGGWVAVNACCGLSPHRGAMLPLGGRINGGERYAIDWSRFDLTARPIVDLVAGTQATFTGDANDNESYFTFGEAALAVADGEVVAVVNDLQDAPPRVFLTLPLADLGGNRVVLKIRDGVYALYGHLKQGSITVRPGDVVKRGQQIAELGNSGNTSEAHLHFHLMDTPEPLTGVNLPWVLDAFDYEGTVSRDGVDTTGAGTREGEMPLMYTAIAFPSEG